MSEPEYTLMYDGFVQVESIIKAVRDGGVCPPAGSMEAIAVAVYVGTRVAIQHEKDADEIRQAALKALENDR